MSFLNSSKSSVNLCVHIHRVSFVPDSMYTIIDYASLCVPCEPRCPSQYLPVYLPIFLHLSLLLRASLSFCLCLCMFVSLRISLFLFFSLSFTLPHLLSLCLSV